MAEKQFTEVKTRWGVVALATTAGVLAAFQIGKIPGTLPALRDDLGLSLVTAGWVVSLVSITGAITGVSVGVMADRLGHVRVVLLSLLCIAAANFAGAYGKTDLVILASRCFEGVGLTLISTSSPVLAMRMAKPEHKSIVMGIWGAFLPAGIGLMVLLTPPLLGSFGWRGVWIANAIVLAAFAAIFAFGTRHLRQTQTGRPNKSLTDLFRDIGSTMTARGSLFTAFCFITFAVNSLAVMAFLPTFLMEEQGLGGRLATVLTSVAIFTGVLGSIVSGWLIQRGTERWAICAIVSAIMGLMSLGIYAPEISILVRYGLCLVFFFSAGFLPVAVWASAPVHAPNPSLVAATNGFFWQGTSVGQLAGPPALAAIVVAYSWDSAPWLMGSMGALGVLFALALRATEIKQKIESAVKS